MICAKALDTVKRIRDGYIISSINPKVDDLLIVDFCVLYKLLTAEIVLSVLQIKKEQFQVCSKKLIDKFQLNCRNYGPVLYYFSNKECFVKPSKKPHKNSTTYHPASCIEEHPISCISNLWSCFKICDIATAKEDQSHEG